jgi:hydrogenase expression/formation protein HypE
VVPTGKADKIFINTAGIGTLEQDLDISGQNGRKGDKVILSGTMADHGATNLCAREELQLGGNLQSDTASLHALVAEICRTGGKAVHVLRDPTRGGVGTTLNELAQSSKIGIRLEEELLPVRNEVQGACELLGLDPFYLANEGKLLAFVSPESTDSVLAAMRSVPEGQEACVIGELVADHPGQVVLTTRVGGRRVIDMLHGEPLPRIC